MKLIPLAGLIGVVLADVPVLDKTREQALSLLRSRRKNSGFFEETRNDDFKRECQEELCSVEELREIYPNDDQKDERDQAWESLTRQCYINQCSAQGTKLCVQTWNVRTCQCKQGWEHPEGGDDCAKDIDECAAQTEENPLCAENAVCANNAGSYTCDCVSGYGRKDGGDDCVLLDACSLCGDNTVCIDNQCNCLAGFVAQQGDASGKVNCADYDECQEEDYCGPNSDCVNTVGSHTCSCKAGFESDGDQCVDVDECTVNSVECGQGACENTPGGFHCACNPGYESVNDVCVDIDECGADDEFCVAGQSCHNTEGSFACCDSETQDFVNGQCSSKDACVNVLCNADQACANGVCECTSPLDKLQPDAEGNCLDLDECAIGTHSCDDDQVCVNIAKGFECQDPVVTDAPTEAPTEAPTQAPTTAAPTEPPTKAAKNSYCENGFELLERHGQQVCVDIDECQTNNGDCGADAPMCMNFYGDRFCYGQMKQETVLCHHEVTTGLAEAPYYKCSCYDDYELCHDQFTCVTTKTEAPYEVFEGDGQAQCEQGQLSQGGYCYSKGAAKATLAAAENDCASQGGELASTNDRRTWWLLGNLIENGQVSFWVNNNSDASSCNMHVVGNSGDAKVANLIGTMHAVPPQWNRVDSSEEHHYWCQF